MKMAIARGMDITGVLPIPTAITARGERTGNFATLSLSDDDKGHMIQIVVTPEVRKVLKSVM